MAFIINGIVGTRLTNTAASAEIAIGTQLSGDGNSRWAYVYAASTINAFDAVMIDQSSNAVPLTTTNSASSKYVGFAQVAIASANYGWVATNGTGIKVNLAANCAPNVLLYTTATAGVLDDAVVSAGNVQGVVATVTISNATATYIIAANPHIGFGSGN